MKRIDSFLTRIAQRHFKDAVVFCISDPLEVWILEKSPEPIELGSDFRDARRALEMYLSAFSQIEKTATQNAASALGGVTSERKKKSSAENGKLGGRPKKQITATNKI